MKRYRLAAVLVISVASACASRHPPETGAGGEVSKASSQSGRGGSASTVPSTSPDSSGPGEAGGGCPQGCATPPAGCLIKGNINLKTGDRVYHVPGQLHYDNVTIEPERGERWFCTEDEAQANGWRRSRK